MTIGDGMLDVLVAFFCYSVGWFTRQRPDPSVKEAVCASFDDRYLAGNRERCPGASDPRCQANNCTAHCKKHCGKRCE